MSFLKQLLTPFVEFDDDKKKGQAPGTRPAPAQQPAPAQVPRTPAPTPAPPAGSTPPAAPAPQAATNAQHPLINPGPTPPAATAQTPAHTTAGGPSTPLPEHAQYFEKLIDEANIKDPMFQGTDFKEFVDSKVDIDDIQDEGLRYRTAFNVLKSTGLTREKLIATGQEYLNLIGRDLNAFQSAHAQKWSKEVRQKELQIQKKAEELQLLTQKINALKGDINMLTQELTLTKDQLNTVKHSFLLAGENKQKEIQTELEKIAELF